MDVISTSDIGWFCDKFCWFHPWIMWIYASSIYRQKDNTLAVFSGVKQAKMCSQNQPISDIDMSTSTAVFWKHFGKISRKLWDISKFVWYWLVEHKNGQRLLFQILNNIHLFSLKYDLIVYSWFSFDFVIF